MRRHGWVGELEGDTSIGWLLIIDSLFGAWWTSGVWRGGGDWWIAADVEVKRRSVRSQFRRKKHSLRGETMDIFNTGLNWNDEIQEKQKWEGKFGRGKTKWMRQQQLWWGRRETLALRRPRGVRRLWFSFEKRGILEDPRRDGGIGVWN